jgi:hypothetical protein
MNVWLFPTETNLYGTSKAGGIKGFRTVKLRVLRSGVRLKPTRDSFRGQSSLVPTCFFGNGEPDAGDFVRWGTSPAWNRGAGKPAPTVPG